MYLEYYFSCSLAWKKFHLKLYRKYFDYVLEVLKLTEKALFLKVFENFSAV